MKLLFFFTTFRQLEENKYQNQIFKQLNNLDFVNLSIDIILHNNNKDFNQDIVTNSFDLNEFYKIKYINSVEVIHTNKNIGYLWGAQEAISDNFKKFDNYDFVIHLNTDIYILNLNYLIQYLYENLNTDYTFFVNKFRNTEYGFKTDLTIFKPSFNVYSNYNNDLMKSKLKPKKIPETLLKYAINANNLKYRILPNIFYPIKLNTYEENKILNNNSIYHVHELSYMNKILNIL